LEYLILVDLLAVGGVEPYRHCDEEQEEEEEEEEEK
jgi:hypothetical protein